MICTRQYFALLLVHEVPNAILLPAGFVRFGAERFFLAVADRLDAIAAHAALNEGILYRVGAIRAQRQVVFSGAALVAVSLNRDVDVGMLLQELRVTPARTPAGRRECLPCRNRSKCPSRSARTTVPRSAKTVAAEAVVAEH